MGRAVLTVRSRSHGIPDESVQLSRCKALVLARLSNTTARGGKTTPLAPTDTRVLAQKWGNSLHVGGCFGYAGATRFNSQTIYFILINFLCPFDALLMAAQLYSTRFQRHGVVRGILPSLR